MAKKSIKAKYRKTVKVNYRQEDDITIIPPTCTSIKCNEYRMSYDGQIDTSRHKQAVGIQYSHNLYVNLHSCEIIHMLQQENFSLNPPWGCKE